MFAQFSKAAACAALTTAVAIPATSVAATFNVDAGSIGGVTFTQVMNPTALIGTSLGSGPIVTTENFGGPAEAVPGSTAGNQFDSPVGLFEGVGGTGSGSTAIAPFNEIQVRSGNNGGRFNVLNPGGNFLDSNDTQGFSWTIFNTGNLTRAEAFITDPNDAGGSLSLSLLLNPAANGPVWAGTLVGNPGDASVWKLDADLTSLADGWETATFVFSIQEGDGIGISNATLSAIPLPAPILLLLSGMGILGGLSMRRRQSA